MLLAPALARRPARPPFRRRRRNGLVPRTIDIDEAALAEALIATGRLTEDEALQPELIERELTALVGDFISRWRNAVTRH